MTDAQLDLAIRIAAVTVMLLLAWLLARRRMSDAPSLLFLPLAICLSGFLLGNTPDAALRPSGALGIAAHLVSGYAVIFLWWFCLACFDRGFRPRGASLFTGIAWFAIASADRGLFGPMLEDKGLSYLLVAIGFGVVAHLAWRLLGDRNGDLLPKRRDARVMVTVLLGGQLLVDLSVDLICGTAWRPRTFAVTQNLALLGFGIWLAGKVLSADIGALAFASPEEAASPLVPAGAEDRSLRRLTTLIEVERVHLDPDLTFALFVARMEMSERTVRTLINRRLGHDHFRSFLNHHRVAEARRLLADPARSGDKLIAISQDSGFASLASFNRVFRDAMGCTPSTYRARAEQECRGNVMAMPGFEERSAAF